MALAALTVKIGADLSDLNRGLTDAQRNVQNFGAGVSRNVTAPVQRMASAATGAGTSFKALREPLTSVTRQLLQLHPAAAQVTSVLGTLAIGTGPMIGILAGIAALALGWKALTKETRDNAKASKDAIEELTKLREKQKLGSLAGTSARAAERNGVDLAEVQRNIDRMVPKVAASFSRVIGGDPVMLKQLVDLQKEETRLRDLIKGFTIEVADIRKQKAEEREKVEKKATDAAMKGINQEKAAWESFFHTLRIQRIEENNEANRITDANGLPRSRSISTTRIAPLDPADVDRTNRTPNLIVQPLNKLGEATRAGFQAVSVAIGTTLAQNLANAFGGGRGAQVGGSVAGAGLGAFAASQFGKAGSFLGSFAGPAGTVIGTLVGGFLGSLFDRQKKSVDQNTAALNRLAEVMNAVPGYKVDAARYRAQKAFEGDFAQRGGVPWYTNPGGWANG